MKEKKDTNVLDNAELSQKTAALEVEIQGLQKSASWRTLDKRIFMDIITIESERLQKFNETSDNIQEIRENAICIMGLAKSFCEMTKVDS